MYSLCHKKSPIIAIIRFVVKIKLVFLTEGVRSYVYTRILIYKNIYTCTSYPINIFDRGDQSTYIPLYLIADEYVV